MDNRVNGVKIISANENISEGSKGIILEYILEGMTEYHSADLSEKVILTMTVLKRFDDILAPAKEAVVKKAEELQAQGMIPVLDKLMAFLYYDSVS